MIGELFQSDWLDRSFQTASHTQNDEKNPQNMKWTKDIKITRGII